MDKNLPSFFSGDVEIVKGYFHVFMVFDTIGPTNSIDKPQNIC
jgi:hypothetical protein